METRCNSNTMRCSLYAESCLSGVCIHIEVEIHDELMH